MSEPVYEPTLSYPNLTTSTVRMYGEDLAVAGKSYIITNDSGTVMTTSLGSVTISGLAI